MGRIGMLTSGGDCQALNTAMRGVAKSLYSVFDDVKIIGFENRHKGLMYADYQITKSSGFSGILTQGGTVLGTFCQPSELIRTPDENRLNRVETTKHTCKKLKLGCLVVLDGNDSQKAANMLSEEELNMVSLPKTTGNDLWGMDMTFRFQSAVDIATNAIGCIHTMAAFHGRIFIMEVMGHKVGWPTLYAGLAGGADIILLPETPYDINIVCDVLTERSKADKHFSILTVTEGATPREDAKMGKKELKEKKKSGVVYSSVACETGAKVREIVGSEVRVMVPDHTQRGDEPCAYDRVLATRPDTATARLTAEERYGHMVVAKNNDITQVPPSEVAGRFKTAGPECSTIKEAKMVGISFGDE